MYQILVIGQGFRSQHTNTEAGHRIAYRSPEDIGRGMGYSLDLLVFHEMKRTDLSKDQWTSVYICLKPGGKIIEVRENNV